MNSERFRLEQSQPPIRELTAFLFFLEGFFYFQAVGYNSSHNSLCPSQPRASEHQGCRLPTLGAEGLPAPFLPVVPLGWRPPHSQWLKTLKGPIAEQ